MDGIDRARALYRDAARMAGDAHALAIASVGRKARTRVRRKLRNWLGVRGKLINRHVQFYGISRRATRARLEAGRSPPAARLWAGIGGIVLHPRTSEYARRVRPAEWSSSFEARVAGGKLWFSRRPNPFRRSPRSRHKAPTGSSLPIDRVGVRVPRNRAARIMLAVARAQMRLNYGREYSRQFRRLRAQRAARRQARPAPRSSRR